MITNSSLVEAQCPVCAFGVASVFFEGGNHPLATLGWPESAGQAQAMPTLPHDFVQCNGCTHVWNRSFSYDAIPYQNNPNRMYNSGSIWKGHLEETRDLVIKAIEGTEFPVVIDIGCGEGHFVRGISEAMSHKGRFIGFDPSASPESGQGVEFHARYYHPLQDSQIFQPTVVTIRHVLEHLTNPASLIDQLCMGGEHLLFAEVPCIDRVFDTGRIADFFYEHTSHFTTESFSTLMRRFGEILTLGHGYDGEVVYALVRANPRYFASQANTSRLLCQRFDRNRAAIRDALKAIASAGLKVAIWGGTGKAAAFMHQFGVDAERFPLVVDSDPEKAGFFVPGVGQEIQFRDVLKGINLDVIIVPTQWRARDIEAEMKREGITAKQILIEHDGALVDLMTGNHPY